MRENLTYIFFVLIILFLILLLHKFYICSEHEACAMDINELNWHVSYRSRVEARIQNKTNIAEVLNSRLKEDIAYVKKHW